MNYGNDDEEETTMKSKKDENIKSWKEKEVKVNNAEPEKIIRRKNLNKETKN